MAYIRLGTLGIEEVFSQMREGKNSMVALGETVKLTGLRLKTFFTKGTSCSFCNNVNDPFFAVERHINNTGFHLNLYGIKNGKEVLMTKDHILAKANGGQDTLENMQPACLRCNNKKADKYIPG